MLWLFFSLDSLSMSWASCLIQLAIWRCTSLQFIFQFQLHCLKTVLNVISFPVWNSTTSFLDNLSLCYFTLNENKIINMCCAIKLSWDDIAIFCRLIGLYLLRKKNPRVFLFVEVCISNCKIEGNNGISHIIILPTCIYSFITISILRYMTIRVSSNYIVPQQVYVALFLQW